MTSPAVAAALDAALAQLLADGAPLGDRLAAYAGTLRDLNLPFAEAVDRLVAKLQDVGAGSGAPALGDVLPAFLLPDEEGRLVSLAELLANGPLVVAFRRGHWCPYCLLATQALTRIAAEVRTRGARLVVITPEREHFAQQMKQRTGAAFPVLCDIDNGYALSLGLAISLGEEMREFMVRRGRDLAAYHGNDAWLLPIPATFVLAPDGRVVMRHVDVDYRLRAAVEDIVSALEALSPSRSV